MTERIKIMGTPGCGKTYTLIAKYATLLNKGYRVQDITCTTFRKLSADDLIAKVRPFWDESAKDEGTSIEDYVGTLHSICYRLLGCLNVVTAEQINIFAREYNYEAYLKPITDAPTDDEGSVYSGELFDLYTWLRNTRTPVEKWYRYPGADSIRLPSHRIPEFIEDYERYKEEYGVIDFSDMIEKVLIKEIPLHTHVLMVDEFQDLTRQQYELIKMWAEDCEIVIIAGDPQQSLYGFWGGSPDYFHEWDAKEIVLGESHRLCTPVWNLGTQILRTERQYPPTVKTREPSGHVINLIDWDQPLPLNAGTELHLVRCNYQAPAIALQLARQGRVFGGLCGWDETEINLFNAILKYRLDAPLLGREMVALAENYPAKHFKYIGRKADFIEFLKSDYKPMLCSDPYIRPELDNILQSDNPTAYIPNCSKLKEAKITGMINRNTPITPDELQKCRILTIHGAKGLEADTVYLHTGITPRIKRSLVIPGEESEAEARVWYVAVTRAKKRLYLIRDVGHNYPLPGVVA